MSQLLKVRKSQALLLSLFYYPNEWLVCSRLLYGSSWLFRLQPIPFPIFPYIVRLVSPSFCLSSFSAFLLQHRRSSLWWMSLSKLWSLWFWGFAQSLWLHCCTECQLFNLEHSAPLFLLLHSAYRNEIKSSHVPYDLPQGKCHLVQKFVPPLKNQKHIGKVLCRLKILSLCYLLLTRDTWYLF